MIARNAFQRLVLFSKSLRQNGVLIVYFCLIRIYTNVKLKHYITDKKTKQSFQHFYLTA
jgi:hypothetical protein